MTSENYEYNWNLAILIAVLLLIIFFWFYKFLFVNDFDKLETDIDSNIYSNINTESPAGFYTSTNIKENS
jgi:hypothetical protein